MQEKNRYLLNVGLVFFAGLFLGWYALMNIQLYMGAKNLELVDKNQKDRLTKIEALFTKKAQ